MDFWDIMNTKKIIAIIACILLFVAITVHHVIVSGRLFDLGDMLHHEFFSFILLAFAVGLGLGELLQ